MVLVENLPGFFAAYKGGLGVFSPPRKGVRFIQGSWGGIGGGGAVAMPG